MSTYQEDRESDAFGSGLACGFVVTAVGCVLIAFLTGHPLIVAVVVTIASAVVTLWYCVDTFGALPFTARYRMGVAYARERDKRAADMVKLGLDPKEAITRAEAALKKEAEEILKEAK